MHVNQFGALYRFVVLRETSVSLFLGILVPQDDLSCILFICLVSFFPFVVVQIQARCSAGVCENGNRPAAFVVSRKPRLTPPRGRPGNWIFAEQRADRTVRVGRTGGCVARICRAARWLYGVYRASKYLEINQAASHSPYADSPF